MTPSEHLSALMLEHGIHDGIHEWFEAQTFWPGNHRCVKCLKARHEVGPDCLGPDEWRLEELVRLGSLMGVRCHLRVDVLKPGEEVSYDLRELLEAAILAGGEE